MPTKWLTLPSSPSALPQTHLSFSTKVSVTSFIHYRGPTLYYAESEVLEANSERGPWSHLSGIYSLVGLSTFPAHSDLSPTWPHLNTHITTIHIYIVLYYYLALVTPGTWEKALGLGPRIVPGAQQNIQYLLNE